MALESDRPDECVKAKDNGYDPPPAMDGHQQQAQVGNGMPERSYVSSSESQSSVSYYALRFLMAYLCWVRTCKNLTYFISCPLVTRSTRSLSNSTEHSPSYEANITLSQSRSCPPFTENEGSLPCSQQCATEALCNIS